MSGRGWDGVTLGREEYQRALREHADKVTADLRAQLAEKDRRIGELTAERDAAEARSRNHLTGWADMIKRSADLALKHRDELANLRASIPTPEALAEAIVRAANGDEDTLWPLITFAEMVADEPLGGTGDLPAVKRILADVIRQAMEQKGPTHGR